MRKKEGFTLVEITVVIAIITLLAAIVFSIGNNMLLKAQVKNTQGTILTLISATNQYRAVFNAYPNLDHPPSGFTGSNVNAITSPAANSSYSENDYKEYNKRLRYTLEDRTYTIDEVEHDPFINQTLPKMEASDEAGEYLYIDAWDNFLRVCPGRDHSGDTPPGPNNLDQDYAASFDTKQRIGTLPDIFSIGPNGIEDVQDTETTTKIDTTDTDFDDIVSWLTKTKYVEENVYSD